METSIAIEVPEYPKTETLFDRNKDTFKVIPGNFRSPEFSLVKRWLVTEKVDGTNVRVALLPDDTVFYGGRTDAAQMPPFLLQMLRDTLPRDLLVKVLRIDDARPVVTLFGEGYGERIQKGGGKYRKGVSFRLFDVNVGGVWLEWENVESIAKGLGIETVPVLSYGSTTENAVDLVSVSSVVAHTERGEQAESEGVVCRTVPLLRDRMGHRVVWKLKAKDF